MIVMIVMIVYEVLLFLLLLPLLSFLSLLYPGHPCALPTCSAAMMPVWRFSARQNPCELSSAWPGAWFSPLDGSSCSAPPDTSVSVPCLGRLAPVSSLASLPPPSSCWHCSRSWKWWHLARPWWPAWCPAIHREGVVVTFRCLYMMQSQSCQWHPPPNLLPSVFLSFLLTWGPCGAVRGLVFACDHGDQAVPNESHACIHRLQAACTYKGIANQVHNAECACACALGLGHQLLNKRQFAHRDTITSSKL